METPLTCCVRRQRRVDLRPGSTGVNATYIHIIPPAVYLRGLLASYQSPVTSFRLAIGNRKRVPCSLLSIP